MVVRGTWAVSNAIGIWGIVCVLWALLPRLENLNEAKDADGGRGRARLSTVVSSKFDSAERKISSTHEPYAFLQEILLGQISIDRDHCNRSNARDYSQGCAYQNQTSAERYF